MIGFNFGVLGLGVCRRICFFNKFVGGDDVVGSRIILRVVVVGLLKGRFIGLFLGLLRVGL